MRLIFRKMILSMFVLTTFPEMVWAANIACHMSTTFPGDTSTVYISGNISVGDDVPRGTILYTAKYSASHPSGIKCDTPDDGSHLEQIKIPHISDYAELPLPEVPGQMVSGSKIYQTNLPGIGVFIRTNQDEKLPSESSIGTVPGGGHNGFTKIFQVSLVKTGPVSPGGVDGNVFPSVSTIAIAPELSGYTFSGFPVTTNTLRFSGQIEVVTSTCSLDESNVIVPLGNHEVQSFSGVGYTTEWKDAGIHLHGCTAFSPGYYSGNNDSISITGSGSLPTGTTDVRNHVSVMISPTGRVIDSSRGIVDITTSTNSASGVGIQIGLGKDEVVPISLSSFIDVSLPESTSNTLSIPVKARYIQTENTVTPGIADGAVTFLVNYY